MLQNVCCRRMMKKIKNKSFEKVVRQCKIQSTNKFEIIENIVKWIRLLGPFDVCGVENNFECIFTNQKNLSISLKK